MWWWTSMRPGASVISFSSLLSGLRAGPAQLHGARERRRSHGQRALEHLHDLDRREACAVAMRRVPVAARVVGDPLQDGNAQRVVGLQSVEVAEPDAPAP